MWRNRFRGGRAYGNIITDRLILLYAGDKIRERGTHLGIVKLQKILFFSQYEMQQSNIAGLHHSYVKDRHGARSSEVYQDRNYLGRAGLFNIEDTEILERGRNIVKSCEEILFSNQEIFDYIDGVIDVVGHMTSYEIRKYGHDYQILFEGEFVKVDDISLGESMLIPLDDDIANISFNIDAEWEESLALMFDAPFMESYWEATSQLKRKTLLSHEEVFGHASPNL